MDDYQKSIIRNMILRKLSPEELDSLEKVAFYEITSKTVFIISQELYGKDCCLVGDEDMVLKLVKMSSLDLLNTLDENRWFPTQEMVRALKGHMGLTSYLPPYINYQVCFSRLGQAEGEITSWVNLMQVKALKPYYDRALLYGKIGEIWLNDEIGTLFPRKWENIQPKFLEDFHLFHLYHLTLDLFLKAEGMAEIDESWLKKLENQKKRIGGERQFGMSVTDLDKLFEQLIRSKMIGEAIKKNKLLSRTEVEESLRELRASLLDE